MENKETKSKIRTFFETNQKRFGKILWGMVLVLSAVVLILYNLPIDFGSDITLWRMILGVFIAAWLISVVLSLRFTDIFFPLAFLFIVFQAPIANACGIEMDVSPWIVLLAALLLTIGFKVMFRRKHVINVNGENVSAGGFKGKGRIGNETMYLDATDLSDVVISDHLGNTELFISNREAYTGGGKITVCDNLGRITLHIPDEWNIVTHSSDNLGQVSIPRHEASGDKSITVVITDNLGQINVVFD